MSSPRESGDITAPLLPASVRARDDDNNMKGADAQVRYGAAGGNASSSAGAHDGDFVTRNEEEDLRRGLHQRHISLIALAGAIVSRTLHHQLDCHLVAPTL